MKLLNEKRLEAGIELPVLSDYLGVSYITLSRYLKEELPCPDNIKKQIKKFLIKNYTECIEKI